MLKENANPYLLHKKDPPEEILKGRLRGERRLLPSEKPESDKGDTWHKNPSPFR
ncbi:MAG: hypothetical protein HY370_02510 [Proteobacteria bacterium]|nr:hypothetical protein [Pseudomonadota bacterium]